MIALDTNLLVRYLVEPDTPQGQVVVGLLETRLTPANPGFVATLTLAEVLWVLGDSYSATPEELRQVVATLMDLEQIVLEHNDAVDLALRSPHRGIADVLLHEIGRKAGCIATLTFDKRFSRVEGVELVA